MFVLLVLLCFSLLVVFSVEFELMFVVVVEIVLLEVMVL